MQMHNTTYQLVSINRDACHTTKIWRKIAPEEEPYIPAHYLELRKANTTLLIPEGT